MASATPPAVPFSRPTTPSHPPSLGFIGLGNMGYPMALNIANSLPPNCHLTVWNRSKAKSEALKKEAGDKVKIAGSVEDVVHASYVVMTSLSSDHVVEEVYTKMFKAHDAKDHQVNHNRVRSTVFVEMSTIYPTLASKLDRLAEANPHRHFVSCPVFGPPVAAKSAQLILVMAGPFSAKKELAYMLVPAVGRKAVDLGENVERAASFKLIGNSMILGTIELLSESMTLAEKSGVGAAALYDFVKDMFPAPSFIGYGQKILNDDFDGSKGFAIEGGLKDASHIRRLVEEKNSPMPIIDIAHQRMLTARAYDAQLKPEERKWKELDWSAMVIGQRVASGLSPLDSEKNQKVVLEETDD